MFVRSCVVASDMCATGFSLDRASCPIGPISRASSVCLRVPCVVFPK